MKIGDKVKVIKNCGRKGMIGEVEGKEEVMSSIFTPNEEFSKINPILNRQKLYNALMALRLEVDQSIVDSLAEIIGEELTQAYEAGRRDAAKEVKTGGWVGEFGDNFGKPPFPLLKTSTQKEDE